MSTFSRLGVMVGVAAALPAQSLVSPELAGDRQRAFDAAAGASQLRCRIDPVRPALDYALRFRTGYSIEFPMSQFEGAGHSLTTFVRVTPEGQKPLFLENSGTLQEVPVTKIDGQVGGTFVVGEGNYDVEVLAQDDAHRVCHSQWRIQAKRLGNERELIPATPAGAVEELSVSRPRPPVSEARNGRITVMLHAASMLPRSSKLQDSDVSALSGSLFTLLQQLPGLAVRLVVFNLAQRKLLFRQDDFTQADMGKVIRAISELQLALVDYRTLQQAGSPADLLTGLIETELRDAKPPEALIVLGPRLFTRDNTAIPAVDKPVSAPPLFYLQFQPQSALYRGVSGPPAGGRGSCLSCGAARGGIMGEPRLSDPQYPMGGPLGITDTIEKLLTRLKGKTLPVRTPHELADGVRRIQTGVGGNALAEGTAAEPVPKFTTPPEGPESATSAPQSPRRPAATSADQSPVAGPLHLPDTDKLPRVEAVPDVDPVDLLMRLRDQVLEHAVRIPNHTCVETIERQRFEPVVGRSPKSCDNLLAARKKPTYPPRLRLDTSDRLRLDVAMAPDKEIYSWAGASRFEEVELDEWIPQGAIGTGPFASFLLATFESRTPRFVYEGDRAIDGRALMEYSFNVPKAQSQYRVKAGKEWVITGYTGNLLVDTKTGELIRLAIRTEELPSETSSCETDSSLEYGSVQLDGSDYLLPKITHQRFIGRDGAEDENIVTFSACRAYQAESTLTFGSGPGAGLAVGARPDSLDLSPGLSVTVDLGTPIDADRSAAGDQIDGRIAKPIVGARREILVPEGALVHGRLMRVETRHSTPPEFTVALRWEAIEVDGARVPLALRPERGAGSLAGIIPGRGLRQRGMTIELPRPGEGSYGVYHSRAGHWEPGFRTEWTTAKP